MGNLTFDEWCRIYDPRGPGEPNWNAVNFVLATLAVFVLTVIAWEYLC